MSHEHDLILEMQFLRYTDLEYEWAYPRRVRLSQQFVDPLLLIPVEFMLARRKENSSEPALLSIQASTIQYVKHKEVPVFDGKWHGFPTTWELQLYMAEWLLHYLRTVPCIILEGPRDIATIRALHPVPAVPA